jgi:predicted ATPase
MPAIKRIGIEGFRRLSNIDIEMRPMMALIGANGVGKTSFMDALSLLAASARGSLNQSLNEMGGVGDVISRGGAKAMVLKAEMNNPGYEPVDYSLGIVPHGQGYSISEESLTQVTPGRLSPFKHIESVYGEIQFYDPDARRLQKPTWEHDTLESALSQVPRMYQQSENLRRTLSSATQYHVLDVGRRAPVKLPQQLRPVVLPGEDGEDLGPFLYNLRETNPEKFEAIEDSLKVAFPGFESLAFPIVATGMIAITWKEKAFRNPFYMHQLSEGTLRFLWLVSLLQSPSLSTITMIDEPEVSLHPELLAILADLMREASGRTQIIVATHSDRLVRFLEPGETVIMDIEEGGSTQMFWGDSLDLEGWLAEYSLDEVWQMGLMGGRA